MSSVRYRLALLADIHGNGIALDAVLEDLRLHKPYLLVIIGDLIGGPHQEEVIQRLRDLNPLVVRGNGEDGLIKLEDGSAPPEWRTHRQFAMARWAYQHLSTDARCYLRSLPAQITVHLPGAQPVCIFHGAPESPNIHLHPALNPGRLTRVFEEIPTASLVFGHSHIPWLEQVDHNNGSRVAINPGAVSEPQDGQIGAQYALFEWDGQQWQASFHCVSYNLIAFERDYKQCGLLATGPLARAHLIAIQRGGNWIDPFFEHAHRLAAERGFPQARTIPDAIWELAGKTFDWQE